MPSSSELCRFFGENFLIFGIESGWTPFKAAGKRHRFYHGNRRLFFFRRLFLPGFSTCCRAPAAYPPEAHHVSSRKRTTCFSSKRLCFRCAETCRRAARTPRPPRIKTTQHDSGSLEWLTKRTTLAAFFDTILCDSGGARGAAPWGKAKSEHRE